jgi:hypothetical protein
MEYAGESPAGRLTTLHFAAITDGRAGMSLRAYPLNVKGRNITRAAQSVTGRTPERGDGAGEYEERGSR